MGSPMAATLRSSPKCLGTFHPQTFSINIKAAFTLGNIQPFRIIFTIFFAGFIAHIITKLKITVVCCIVACNGRFACL